MGSFVIATTLVAAASFAVMTASAPGAYAAGTVLFNQPFHDNTVDGSAGTVSIPAAPTHANVACLSASGNASTNPLLSCSTAPDSQGAGKLRLTAILTGQEGGIFAGTSVPTSQGLDVKFNSYQYGGVGGADGIAFALAAVDPANPVTPSVIGQSGGALGYSATNSTTAGLTDGYLGVGIDAYGNFSNKYEGTGCTDPANISKPMAGEVVIRGPGNGTVGYCPLQSSAATGSSQALTLRAATRSASVIPVEVVFNPSSASVTTASGLVVPAGDYDVNFTPVGGATRNLINTLPVVPAGLYPASWINANGIPKQLAFGWVASTGASTDYHELDNVVVSSLNPVPQLAVSQTSYAAATLVPGSPVTYTVAASSTGAAEHSPVTVIETLPTGVVPVGAEGSGWVCQPPSGQQVSCTASTNPFLSGTITVNGVVNSSTVTQTLIRTGTSAAVSSGDADPATASTAPAGTVPAAPVVTGVAPTNGPAGGDNDVTVSGSNLSGATAIEIGTTAEFAAGTPATLLLCSSPAPGCFTVTSDSSLDISAMPGHVMGSVQLSVVSLGIAGTVPYTYNAGPALLFPAPPSGEANVAYSDQLTVTGGTSPYAWSVSTGTLPPGLTLNASTGLLSGTPTSAGSYPFTVHVTDQGGLSDSEPVTLVIIPGPSLNFPAPPAGWTRTVYGDTLTESGGTSPLTWTVSSGSLPAGISLSADGNLSGTPTAIGLANFTVQVTDANGQSATQATSINVSAGVSTTFAAPPRGTVNTSYSDTLTATGGTAPYSWSVNAGTLPPGLTLTTGGVLAGTPTAGGSYTFTVNAIDQNNGVATTSITLVIATASTTTGLTTSVASVTFGTAVTLTATVAPSAATGSVTFKDLLSSGPQSGQTVTLGTRTLSGGTATLTVSLPAFNTNTITATYGGDSNYATSTSALAVVQVSAFNGEVIIDQFRLSGPGGGNDQYVQLYNGGAAVSLAGFTLTASSGATITLPVTAPTLATGHSDLIAGAGYSLGAVAAADSTGTNLGSAGLQVTAPDAAGTVVDAVGNTSAKPGYASGSPLPALSGSPTDQYAWVRLESAGLPINTGNNATDFKLVSTTAGVVGGVQSTLGSPSPLASGSPKQANGSLLSTLLDPAQAGSAAPNQTYVPGSPGQLTLRRTITNTTGGAVTTAEIRIASLSEANGAPEPGVGTQPGNPAALRLVNPLTSTSQVIVTGGQAVTVQNLSVDAPANASPGGGLDTTLTIPLSGGLAAGASVNIALTIAVDAGGSYWLGYDVDALGGAIPAIRRSSRPKADHAPAPRSATHADPGNAGGHAHFAAGAKASIDGVLSQRPAQHDATSPQSAQTRRHTN